MTKFKAIRIIGIGDDGCLGLSSRAYNASIDCQVLVGGERQLAFFPDHPARKITIKGKLSKLVAEIASLSEDYNIGVLASGDPLFFGIGSLIVKKVGIDHVDIIPSPSSIQLAFAKIGQKWNDARVISIHGRSIEGLVTKLQTTKKAALLTDGDNSPQRVAQLLSYFEDTNWNIWVCENLCGSDEQIRQFSVEELALTKDISPLNVMILERIGKWNPPSVFPFNSEDEFGKRLPKKGLITKSEVRALSLAKLNIRPGDIIWDIGAGSGSIAIESAKLCPEGHVFAVECDPKGIPYCEDNIKSHRVDNVRLIHDRAPECLDQLDDPNGVFIGGSKGSMVDIVCQSYHRLKPGGRLVVNAVTLENVGEAQSAFKKLNLLPELVLIQISRGVPLAGKYLKYEALNPIHMFSITKEESHG